MVDTNSMGRTARSATSTARSSVARPGLIGRGIFYALFGMLALDLAIGSSDPSEGAVERVASAPLGRFLLIGIAVALVALVAWKVFQAIGGDPVEGSDAGDRATYALKALAYGGLALTVVAVLVANWSGSSSTRPHGGEGQSEQQATATVLAWPAGQWLVVVAGIAIVGFALYELYEHTIRSAFMTRIDVSSLREATRDVVEWSGRLGYAGKAAITAVVGAFLVVAGVQHDPDEATGLSGALRDLADSRWGVTLLIVVGVGLFLFAAFSFVEAGLRRTA